MDRSRFWLPSLIGWLVFIGLLIAALVWSSKAYAEAIAQVVLPGGVRIVLYTETCTLPEMISNLPKKAIWEEGGKVFDGCYGVHQDFGLVFFYFSDKTVTAVPAAAFKKVVGA